MEQLLERDDELDLLGAALRDATAGAGSLVLVEGAAGIGKSTLLAHARADAAAAGLRVLRARGAEREGEFPFGVVRQLLEPALAEAGPGPRERLLQGPARRAADLLGLPGGDPREVLAAPDPGFAVLHGLYWLCANLAAEHPLLVVVDDAHWADASSLRFLAFLRSRVAELPIAMILALRPDETGQAGELLAVLAGDAEAALVRPGALSEAAVGRLLAARLASQPAHEFVAAAARATGGTPFLVEQLARAFADEGIAPSAAAAPRVEELGARPIARWVLARLARLPAAAGALARAVAVLETAEPQHAAALAGLEHAAAATATDALVRAGLLAPGRPLTFAHPLVRASVYGAMPSGERAAAHRAAASLLEGAGMEPERLAEHLLAAEPAGDPAVVERLLAVSRSASARGAAESTAAYLRRALAEPPAPEQRAEVLLALGMAEFSAGSPDAVDRLRAAQDAAPAGAAQVTVAAARSHVLLRAGRTAEAIEALDRARAGAPPELAPVLEIAAAGVATIDAATAPAVAARLRTLRAAADDPGASRELLALAAFAAVEANEPAAAGAALALRAFAASPTAVPEPPELPWWSQSTIALVWTERFAEVAPLLDAGVAHGRANGDSALLAAALAFRAQVALRLGDLRGAEDDARTAYTTPGMPAPLLWAVLAAGTHIDALVELGRLDEAQEVAAAHAGAAESELQTAAVLRHARGRLALARRQPAAALADVEAARDLMHRCHTVCRACMLTHGDLALAHRALGEVDAAVRAADEDVALARAFGAPGQLGVALTAAGVVRDREREGLLREAVDVLAGTPQRLALARAQAELGALLRRENRRRDAQELLREALATARRAGAEPLAAFAEDELRATGARPRRVALRGAEALTASERRVARLAGAGLTNREIAQELFVTARTVEGHLTQAYGKLGVRSRAELAPALEAAAALIQLS
jgi:DNA-binding CsgD family transcriptional regulator